LATADFPKHNQMSWGRPCMVPPYARSERRTAEPMAFQAAPLFGAPDSSSSRTQVGRVQRRPSKEAIVGSPRLGDTAKVCRTGSTCEVSANCGFRGARGLRLTHRKTRLRTLRRELLLNKKDDHTLAWHGITFQEAIEGLEKNLKHLGLPEICDPSTPEE